MLLILLCCEAGLSVDRTASLHDVTGASRDVLPRSRPPESGQSMLDGHLPVSRWSLSMRSSSGLLPTGPQIFDQRKDSQYERDDRQRSDNAHSRHHGHHPMVVSMWSIIARRSAYKISKHARYRRPHASHVRSA